MPTARALATLKSAASLNNVHAMYALGKYYAAANGTATTASAPTTTLEMDEGTCKAEITSLWTAAAIAGHASAQRDLGLMYAAASPTLPIPTGSVPLTAEAAPASPKTTGRPLAGTKGIFEARVHC